MQLVPNRETVLVDTIYHILGMPQIGLIKLIYRVCIPGERK